MKHKLLAAAIAAAFAAPAAALAQTSVTITGFVKVEVGSISNSGASTTAAGLSPRAGLNTSESRLQDEGSRIIFTVRDDLGAGLAGIAQIDLRPTIDGNSGVNGGGAGAGFGSSTGNNYIGLESRDWGTLRLGALDQHYTFNTDTSSTYGPQQLSPSLINYTYIAQPVAGVTSNAATQLGVLGQTRTNNLVRYDSPNWNGFRLGAGYSFNATSGQEADLTSGGRHGRAINIAPTYTADIWRVGYSYLDDKRDAPVGSAATGNWKGHRLYGEIKWSDFTVGLNWDSTRVAGETAAGVVTQLSNRTAWSLPVKWQTGKHIVTGVYSKANSDKVLVGDTSAKFWSLGYAYLFSARTSVGLGYAQVSNGALGTYTLWNDQPKGGASGANFQNGYASGNSSAYTGEKQSYFGVSLRQSF